MRTIYPRLFWLEPPSKPLVARRGSNVHRAEPWAVRLPWTGTWVRGFATHQDAVAWASEQAAQRIETKLREDLDEAPPTTIFDFVRDTLIEPSARIPELIFPPVKPLHYDHVHWGFSTEDDRG